MLAGRRLSRGRPDRQSCWLSLVVAALMPGMPDIANRWSNEWFSSISTNTCWMAALLAVGFAWGSDTADLLKNEVRSLAALVVQRGGNRAPLAIIACDVVLGRFFRLSQVGQFGKHGRSRIKLLST